MGRFYVCPKTGLKRGAWTPEEDNLLAAYVKRYGHCNWRELPKHAGLSRCGKSCRLRWLNYLRPSVKRGGYTKEEEELIIKLHEKLGNKWSVMAANLPGRSDNEIKNHWHCHLKKRTTQNTTTKKRKKSQNIMECKNISEADYRTFPSMGISALLPLLPHNSSVISEAIPDFDYIFWSELLEMDEFHLPREASVSFSPSVPSVETGTLVPISYPNSSESSSSGVESLLSSEPYLEFHTDFWNQPFHLDESLVPYVESSTAVPLSPPISSDSSSSSSGVESLLSLEPRLEFDTTFWNEPFHMDDLFMEDNHPVVSMPPALSESVYPYYLYNVYDMDKFFNH